MRLNRKIAFGVSAFILILTITISAFSLRQPGEKSGTNDKITDDIIVDENKTKEISISLDLEQKNTDLQNSTNPLDLTEFIESFEGTSTNSLLGIFASIEKPFLTQSDLFVVEFVGAYSEPREGYVYKGLDVESGPMLEKCVEGFEVIDEDIEEFTFIQEEYYDPISEEFDSRLRYGISDELTSYNVEARNLDSIYTYEYRGGDYAISETRESFGLLFNEELSPYDEKDLDILISEILEQLGGFTIDDIETVEIDGRKYYAMVYYPNLDCDGSEVLVEIMVDIENRGSSFVRVYLDTRLPENLVQTVETSFAFQSVDSFSSNTLFDSEIDGVDVVSVQEVYEILSGEGVSDTEYEVLVDLTDTIVLPSKDDWRIKEIDVYSSFLILHQDRDFYSDAEKGEEQYQNYINDYGLSSEGDYVVSLSRSIDETTVSVNIHKDTSLDTFIESRNNKDELFPEAPDRYRFDGVVRNKVVIDNSFVES